MRADRFELPHLTLAVVPRERIGRERPVWGFDDEVVLESVVRDGEQPLVFRRVQTGHRERGSMESDPRVEFLWAPEAADAITVWQGARSVRGLRRSLASATGSAAGPPVRSPCSEARRSRRHRHPRQRRRARCRPPRRGPRPRSRRRRWHRPTDRQSKRGSRARAVRATTTPRVVPRRTTVAGDP